MNKSTPSRVISTFIFLHELDGNFLASSSSSIRIYKKKSKLKAEGGCVRFGRTLYIFFQFFFQFLPLYSFQSDSLPYSGSAAFFSSHDDWRGWFATLNMHTHTQYSIQHTGVEWTEYLFIIIFVSRFVHAYTYIHRHTEQLEREWI